MSFGYLVNSGASRSDPTYAPVIGALNSALAKWSQYIDGPGSLVVQLNFQPAANVNEIASGGPTAVSYLKSVNGKTVNQSDAVSAIATGTHVTNSDITITYDTNFLSQASQAGFDLTTVLEHELMHGLGVIGYRNGYTGYLGSTETTFDVLSAFSGGGDYFTGAAASYVYGGNVPLTLGVGPGSNYYHVGATGTTADPGVLRNDLIYPYAYSSQSITALDVAILEDLGYTVTAAGQALVDPNPTSTISAASGGTVTDAALSGVTQPDEVVQVLSGGTVVGQVKADGAGNWFLANATLADGTYQFVAQSYGANGLVTVASKYLVLDTASPLHGAYWDILGRDATAAELSGAQAQLRTGTAVSSVRAYLSTTGYAAAAVGNLWKTELGRAIGAGELASVESGLAAGNTLASVRQTLATSTEAANTLGYVFGAVANRPISSAELSADQVLLANYTAVATIRANLAYSGEVIGQIQFLYGDVLGRGAGAAEVSAVQAGLAAGSSLAGIRNYAASGAEIAARLGQAYTAIAGRAITNGELGSDEGALAGGASLAGLLRYLAQGAEVAGQLGYIYQSVVGRTASAPELAFNQASLAGGASLSGLRAALATGAEAAGQVQYLYGAVLARGASAAELSSAELALGSRGATLGGLRGYLVASAEAVGDLQAAYTSELGRAPTAAELGAGEQALGNGASLGGIRGYLSTTAEAAAGVQTVYSGVFGRAPAAAELPGAQAAVASGGLAGLQAVLAGGTEFAGDVNAAFQAAAGRPANAVELAADRSEINPFGTGSVAPVTLATIQAQVAELSGGTPPRPAGFAATAPISPQTIAGSAGLVYGLFNNDALVSAQAVSVTDIFSGPSGGAIVRGFNPATDLIQVESRQAASFGALGITAGGADTTISLTGGAQIILASVSSSSLTAANFRFV